MPRIEYERRYKNVRQDDNSPRLRNCWYACRRVLMIPPPRAAAGLTPGKV